LCGSSVSTPADVYRAPLAMRCTLALLVGAAGHGHMVETWTKPPVPAGVTVKQHNLTFGEETFVCHVAMPGDGTAVGTKGALVFPQWMGLTHYEEWRAEELAAMGYHAIAVDLYGDGLLCNGNMTCSGANAGKVRTDNARTNGIVNEALKALAGMAPADKLVAMGYCLGGSVALELARHPNAGASAGYTLAAVSSFHGGLDPISTVAAEGSLATDVQVHHAELERGESHVILRTWEDEFIKAANGTTKKWQSFKYSHCEHGWTEPGTDIYRPRESVRAHTATYQFFEHSLGSDAHIAPVCMT